VARPKRHGGKPSYGPRDRFNIAVPEAVGDRIRDLADERRVTFNTLISDALTDYFGVTPEPSSSAPETEELPLPA